MLKKVLILTQAVVFVLVAMGSVVAGTHRPDVVEQIFEPGLDDYQGVKDATLY